MSSFGSYDVNVELHLILSEFIYVPTNMFMTAPILMPVAEHPLQTMLVHQIDYYFRYFDILVSFATLSYF